MTREELVESAEELVARLAPHSPEWGPEPRDWVFRGQRDSTWGLTPSAWREDSVKEFVARAPTSRGERIEVESHLLRRFAMLADVQGLPTLADPTDCMLRAGEEWLPKRLHAHAALAQHYGVPTRLLDWSKRPLVAAWFAAEGAAREPLVGGRLAVWALRRSRDRQEELLSPQGVQVVRAPRASNPNLHLQSGLFTICEDERPLDAVLDGFGDALFKITLPVQEAGRLLRILAQNFVQGATVYAGYEGVTRSMKEARFRRA